MSPNTLMLVAASLVWLATPELLPFGKPVRDAYFQFAEGSVYFNHGGFGATPTLVIKALENYTAHTELDPTGWFHAGYHLVLREVRDKIARMLNCNISEIVFTENDSSGMNAILRSIDWKRGDILMLTSVNYPVVRYTGSFLEEQYGIRKLVVNITFPATGPETFMEPVREALTGLSTSDRARVRLVLFDHVSSYPAMILPVQELTRLVKAETDGKALVMLDGAHALAQIHVDLKELRNAGVDFYVGDGHKWLMAPRGSAVLWVAPEHQSFVQPTIISSENSPGTPFQGRFDYIGERDYGPWCSMRNAVDFRKNELGGEDRIISYIHDLAVWGGEHLAQRFGTQTISPSNMTPALAVVQMPVPKTLSAKAQSDCANHMNDVLLNKHKMRFVGFSIDSGQHLPRPGPWQGGPPNVTYWGRLSAMVYLDRQDFEDFGTYTLEIASQCKETVLV